MSQLTAQQRASLAAADADGRALVTMIDGRLAILLPAVPESDQAEWLELLAGAIDAATARKGSSRS